MKRLVKLILVVSLLINNVVIICASPYSSYSDSGSGNTFTGNIKIINTIVALQLCKI